MRIHTIVFLSTLMALCVLGFAPKTYAQDTTMEEAVQESVESENAEQAPPAEERAIADPEDLYDIATDAQIAEAQRYYTSCSNNEALSARKDCKCAAAQYLETRVKKGSAVPPEEIVKANVNSCLKEGVEPIDPEDSTFSNITDTQIEEAQGVFRHCKSNDQMSTLYDCECFASRFLEERIKAGPMPSYQELFPRFRTDCRNIVETTGQTYSQCMSMPIMIDIGNIERKDYCECYAREWAKRFKGYTGSSLDPHKLQSLKVQAMQACIAY